MPGRNGCDDRFLGDHLAGDARIVEAQAAETHVDAAGLQRFELLYRRQLRQPDLHGRLGRSTPRITSDNTPYSVEGTKPMLNHTRRPRAMRKVAARTSVRRSRS